MRKIKLVWGNLLKQLNPSLSNGFFFLILLFYIFFLYSNNKGIFKF